MKALFVLAVLVLILLLLGQVRVGGRAEFSAEGFFLWIRLGRFKLKILPAGPKEEKIGKPKKPKKEKEPKKPKKEKPPTPLPEKIGGALEYAQALLPVALEAAKGMWRGLRVDRLELELTAGASDPGDAALVYGQANAALGALWLPLTRALRVKDGSARVRMDFDADRLTVYGRAAVSIRIGCLTRIALVNGIQGLKRALAVRKRRKRKQRKAA